MKAKCPYCESGCGCCKDGFFEVEMAVGDWFARECTNLECLFVNGGHHSEGYPDVPSEPCVVCGEATKWTHFGDVEHKERPYKKNEQKFALKREKEYNKQLQERYKSLQVFAKKLLPSLERVLTRDEAYLLGVCRICRGKDSPRRGDPFVYGFGNEYAHESCLGKGIDS